MSDQKTMDLSIVGRNVSAAAAAFWAKFEFQNVAWFEGPSNDREASWFWLPLVNPAHQSICSSISYDLSSPVLMWNDRKYSLDELPPSWHPALHSKILSLALFNDLSPFLTLPNGQRNFHWTEQRSRTSTLLKSLPVKAVQVGKALRTLKKQAAERNIWVEDSEHWVTSVQPDLGLQRLVMNASFGIRQTQQLMIVQNDSHFDFDSYPTSPIQNNPNQAVGVWKSFGSWRPSSEWTYWPRFSIVISKESGQELVDTGLFKSGSVRRMWSLPFERGLSWVQEDVYIDLENPDNQTSACFLTEQAHTPVPMHCLNENFVYNSVTSLHHRFTPHMSWFHQGTIDGQEAFQRALRPWMGKKTSQKLKTSEL